MNIDNHKSINTVEMKGMDALHNVSGFLSLSNNQKDIEFLIKEIQNPKFQSFCMKNKTNYMQIVSRIKRRFLANIKNNKSKLLNDTDFDLLLLNYRNFCNR